MGAYAKWVKPMIYRFGNGPSSLRSEIPALINELGAYLALDENEVMNWVGSQIEDLRSMSRSPSHGIGKSLRCSLPC